VIAVDKEGRQSFASEPVVWNPGLNLKEVYFTKGGGSIIQAKGFLGEGFIEISKSKNKDLKIKLQIAETGKYALRFRYANGNGPVNTENKCAIRSLRKEKSLLGTFVFPQRGSGEWSNWGMSNSIQVKLEKGEHTFHLVLESPNENMNGDVNQALLNFVELVKVD